MLPFIVSCRQRGAGGRLPANFVLLFHHAVAERNEVALQDDQALAQTLGWQGAFGHLSRELLLVVNQDHQTALQLVLICNHGERSLTPATVELTSREKLQGYMTKSIHWKRSWKWRFSFKGQLLKKKVLYMQEVFYNLMFNYTLGDLCACRIERHTRFEKRLLLFNNSDCLESGKISR